MTIKVVVIGGGPQYVAMFNNQLGWECVSTIAEADIIQFTGGEDVSPVLYGEASHAKTYNNKDRDDRESKIFEQNIGKKPMIGICRGGQFLNVMNGGRLYQHVDNHAIGHTHPVYSESFQKSYNVTSTHHQMMRTGKHGFVEGFALGLSSIKESISETGALIANTKDKKDVEVVWYDDTKCLCFQPHPEFHGANETRDYYFALLNKLIQ